MHYFKHNTLNTLAERLEKTTGQFAIAIAIMLGAVTLLALKHLGSI